MKTKERIQYILNWIKKYCNSIKYQPTTLVVGVSGGVDSAVTSTLLAKTGLKTIAVSMPIKQNHKQHDLSLKHLEWLTVKFKNVSTEVVVLDNVFNSFQVIMKGFDSEIAFANSRSRLRMVTLYQIAQSKNGLVVGTGNKVEDFGVGFFTKYGDGGVDISPIADLMKSEVYAIAESLGIIQEIQDAAPTDGLWPDGRTDEDQIGATYAELEWAMRHEENSSDEELTERQRQVLEIYRGFNKANSHKMNPIPVFKNTHRQ